MLDLCLRKPKITEDSGRVLPQNRRRQENLRWIFRELDEEAGHGVGQVETLSLDIGVRCSGFGMDYGIE